MGGGVCTERVTDFDDVIKVVGCGPGGNLALWALGGDVIGCVG